MEVYGKLRNILKKVRTDKLYFGTRFDGVAWWE
jgi:hypothetical protein